MGKGVEGELIASPRSWHFGLKAFGTAFGCAFVLAGTLGIRLMGAGFNFNPPYAVPLAGFCGDFDGAGLMTRLAPYGLLLTLRSKRAKRSKRGRQKTPDNFRKYLSSARHSQESAP
jgi:hypothetical protein